MYWDYHIGASSKCYYILSIILTITKGFTYSNKVSVKNNNIIINFYGTFGWCCGK